ncbi:hypothetical protein KCP74_08845 [Salmonella enterica subsp. enterica]|nr:hypothetical protein KCP74_08845 [Salmonella enterica subsp. enterica]
MKISVIESAQQLFASIPSPSNECEARRVIENLPVYHLISSAQGLPQDGFGHVADFALSPTSDILSACYFILLGWRPEGLSIFSIGGGSWRFPHSDKARSLLHG